MKQFFLLIFLSSLISMQPLIFGMDAVLVASARDSQASDKNGSIPQHSTGLATELSSTNKQEANQQSAATNAILEELRDTANLLLKAEQSNAPAETVQHVVAVARNQHHSLKQVAEKVVGLCKKIDEISDGLEITASEDRLKTAEKCYEMRDYKSAQALFEQVARQNANPHAKKRALRRLQELDEEQLEITICEMYNEGLNALAENLNNAREKLGRVARQNRWPHLQGMACHFLANNYYDNGDTVKACEFYKMEALIKEMKEITELRPMYAHAHERLGYVAYTNGDKNTAFQYLNTIYEELIKPIQKITIYPKSSSWDFTERQGKHIVSAVHPYTAARILTWLGVIHYQNNN